MPRYTVTANATLYAEIVPQGSLTSNEILDLDDTTYFGSRELEYDLEFQFEVEVDEESEDAARDEAYRLMNTIRYRGDEIDWEVCDPDIVEITPLEEPMTLELAIQILREWMGVPSHANARERPITVTLTPELMRALDYLLAYNVARMAQESEVAVAVATD